MKRPLNFGILERLNARELEYEEVRLKTNQCLKMGLKFGISFYAPVRLLSSNVVKYKRIEIWCVECPSWIDVLDLMEFFKAHPPKQNNTCFAYYQNKIQKVENWRS